MDTSLLLLLALPAGLLLVWWWLRRPTRGSGPDPSRPHRGDALDTVAGWPPEATRVLAAPERQAHAMLAAALPDHMVLAQVPLSRFVRVPTRNSYHEWLRRVGQISADLVVCDASSQVIAVVELRRPPGKDNERTLRRHQRMDRVLEAAGVRVVVWNEESLPHAAAVREQVLPKPAPPVVRPPAAATMTPASTKPVRIEPAGPKAEPLSPAAAPRRITTLEEVLDEIDHAAPARRTAPAEPTPSTWFDDLDSAPAPLDRPRP